MLHSSFVVESTLAYHVCEVQRKMNLPLYSSKIAGVFPSMASMKVRHAEKTKKKNPINSTVRQLTVSKQWNLIY